MVARWSVSPFGTLWPTMDAAFGPDDRLQHDIAGTLSEDVQRVEVITSGD